MEGGGFEIWTNPPITPHLDIPSEAARRGGTSRYGVPGGFLGGFGFTVLSSGCIPEQGTNGYGAEMLRRPRAVIEAGRTGGRGAPISGPRCGQKAARWAADAPTAAVEYSLLVSAGPSEPRPTFTVDCLPLTILAGQGEV